MAMLYAQVTRKGIQLAMEKSESPRSKPDRLQIWCCHEPESCVLAFGTSSQFPGCFSLQGAHVIPGGDGHAWKKATVALSHYFNGDVGCYSFSVAMPLPPKHLWPLFPWRDPFGQDCLQASTANSVTNLTYRQAHSHLRFYSRQEC